MSIPEDYKGPSGKILPGTGLSNEEIFAKLGDLMAQQNIPLAYLFGSYALEEEKNSSDIDIAILLECSEKELYSRFREIMLSISEILNSERFDLVLLDYISPVLKFKIISEGKVIYAKNEMFLNNYEMNVIREYQDTEYLRNVQNNYLEGRVKNGLLRK